MMNRLRISLIGAVTLLCTRLCFGFQGGSYLDSLSQAPSHDSERSSTTSEYLSSLTQGADSVFGNKAHDIVNPKPVIFDLDQTAASTPEDHYAKNHPGAGWAGYKHPQSGGYLDNLKENNWKDGKEADYGSDIRWGAQVYLDALK